MILSDRRVALGKCYRSYVGVQWTACVLLYWLRVSLPVYCTVGVLLGP